MNAINEESKLFRLSPARLGEAMAWLGYFPPAARSEVLRCLGCDEAVFERDAAETRVLLASSLEQGDVGPTLDFARAFDLTDRRARARRPRVGAVRAAANLEPAVTVRRPAPVLEMVPLEYAETTFDPRPQTSTSVPTYLQRRDTAATLPEVASAPTSLAITTPPSTAEMATPAPMTTPSAAVLPFQRGSGPVTRESSRSSTPPGIRLDTGTVNVDDAPSAPPLAPELKAFASVTRYAELVAELRSAPTSAEIILTRAGLKTSDARSEVHRHWRVTFDADPGLRARFERLCEALMRKRA